MEEMSNIELGLIDEINYVLEEINLDRNENEQIILDEKKIKKIVEDLMTCDSMWEVINEHIEDEIYDLL